MNVTMAEKRPQKRDQKPEPISFRPRPDVARALKEFRDSLVIDPGNAKVIDQALRYYLRSQGISISEKPDSDD
jgi:hypothetical protein